MVRAQSSGTRKHLTFLSASPGRHFASYEMKLMLAYIVLHYEIKLEPGSEGVRPANTWVGNSIIPNRKAKILFKKRAKA